jgi:hypothetical protein
MQCTPIIVILAKNYGFTTLDGLLILLIIFCELLYILSFFIALINLFKKNKKLLRTAWICALPGMIFSVFLVITEPKEISLLLLSISMVLVFLIYRGSPKFQRNK